MQYKSQKTGTIALKSGDLLCPLRNAHFEISGSFYKQQFVSFSGLDADRLAHLCGFTLEHPALHQAPAEAARLMKEIILEVRENNTPNPLFFEARLLHIGSLLWRGHHLQKQHRPTYSEQIRQVVLKHEFEPLNIEQIAAELQVVPDTLRKACIRELGQTTVQFLTELRLNRAKELLERTPYKIMHISTAAGFRDEKHFFRLFKKHTGLTPADWRKQHSSF